MSAHILSWARVLTLSIVATLVLSGCGHHRGHHRHRVVSENQAGMAASPADQGQKQAAQALHEEPEVTVGEDLMREHGLLRRVMLIYEESMRRAQSGSEVPADIVHESAGMVRRFVEDYHEKLEEDYLFTRFEKAGVLAKLSQTLRDQHQAGRRLTDEILRVTGDAQTAQSPQGRQQMVVAMQAFIRMYRPHAAREDTVLFPALPKVASSRELADLAEQFENRERELFGKDGYEKMVARVAELEGKLGIRDLAKFTAQ